MTKPYQDQLEKLSPKDYIRYLRDEEGLSFQQIGDNVVPHQKTASGRRGTAKKMYDLPSENKKVHKFSTEPSKAKVRTALQDSDVWDKIPRRMRYSRAKLGRSPKRDTPRADIVFYFKPERTIEKCKELAERFDTQGAMINFKWEYREITSEDDMKEGASIITTDNRKKTYHSSRIGGVWTVQTSLQRYMDVS